jgi:hypothetical protein
VREADVPKRLLKQVGDPVEAREIIIAKPINLGTAQLVYRAPAAGQIVAIQGSWMILDVYDTPLDVMALYSGSIVSVVPRRGGIVEAQGALIQGAWGSGQEQVGVIKWFTKSSDAILDAGLLEPDVSGTILVSGGGVTAELLTRANELQAAGIVTGSLAPDLRGLACSLNVAVLVTEGFGSVPMSAAVFDLLTLLNGQKAAINARFQPRGRDATRPELFVPLAASRMQESDQADDAQRPVVTGGARVRGTCAPYLGRTGTLPHEFALQWVTTDAGTQVPGVTVEWSDALTSGDGGDERDTVPWTNLELIG